jgi:hypothetical protein
MYCYIPSPFVFITDILYLFSDDGLEEDFQETIKIFLFYWLVMSLILSQMGILTGFVTQWDIFLLLNIILPISIGFVNICTEANVMTICMDEYVWTALEGTTSALRLGGPHLVH